MKPFAAVLEATFLWFQLCRVHNNAVTLPGFVAKNIIRNSERVPSETPNQSAPQREINCTLAHA